MEQAESIVLTINISLILISYFYVYPRTAGSDLNKFAINDLMATAVSLVVNGAIFWGSDYSFNLLILHVNWFWFTLVSYIVMELPFTIWYFKKHGISMKG